MSKSDRLLSELQAFPERDLCRDVLKPLFTAMGYERVEFHDGPDEQGKDLICIGRDEVDELKITVIQVKKYRFSRRATDKRDFREVVNQLCQAAETPVETHSAGRQLPTHVYFVTPYNVPVKTLRTRFERYDSLRIQGLRIIDGPKLIALLQKHVPRIIIALGGKRLTIESAIRSQLTNSLLMSALHSSDERKVDEFYTDIDFSLGKQSTQLFFDTETDAKRIKVNVGADEWRSLKKAAEIAKEQLEICLFDRDPQEVEKPLQKIAAAYESWCVKRDEQLESINNINKVFEIAIDQFQHSIEDLFNSEIPSISILQEQMKRGIFAVESAKANLEAAKDSSRSLLDRLEKQLEAEQTKMWKAQSQLHLLETLSSMKGLPESSQTSESNLRREKDKLSRIMKDALKFLTLQEIDTGNIQTSYEQVLKAAKDHLLERLKLKKLGNAPEEPRYSITIDGPALADFISQKKKWIQSQVKQINNDELNIRELRLFLEKCEGFISATGVALKDLRVSEAVGINVSSVRTELRTEDSPYRLRIPLSQIFDTGLSVCVLGEAGAGKTTSLQMYAQRFLDNDNSENLPLFASIPRLVQAWQENDPSVRPKVARNEHATIVPPLEEGLLWYIRSLDGAPDISIVDLSKDLSERPSILLLDGIDEAIKAAPWLLESIKSFSVKYSKAQMITSSRMSGEYVEEIPFVAVTLMEFTSDQREQFIKKWFGQGQSKHARAIGYHLSNNQDLAQVVRNPLLATVLCVLQSRGIPLPDTEVRLYEERMRLLLGYYDLVKQIDRIVSDLQYLEFISRKIAFFLQRNDRIAENRETLYLLAEREFHMKLSREASRRLVDELIDPCNVLVPMTNDGKIGFGHRRFLEYLVACELKHERGIQMEPYLGSDWWRGVFELYSQMSTSIDWLIERIRYQRNLGPAIKTLEAMVAVRPREERTMLGQLLRSVSSESRNTISIDLDWPEEYDDNSIPTDQELEDFFNGF